MKPRAAVRYFGAKVELAAWITRYFPEHTTYVEPFGGSAAVLLNKVWSKNQHEVYNDLDHSLVTFFQCLRDRPDDLIRAVQLTPWSREEVNLKPWDDPTYTTTSIIEVAHTLMGVLRPGAGVKVVQAAVDDLIKADRDLEVARRFYTRAEQGRGNAPSNFGVAGWKFFRGKTSGTVSDQVQNNVSTLRWAADRFRHVQIESSDAIKVVELFDSPETLFYVDPPYVDKAHRYRIKFDDKLQIELAAALHAVKGYVVLSGYNSASYDELYGDFERRVKAIRQDHPDGSQPLVDEVLWISPRTMDAVTIAGVDPDD